MASTCIALAILFAGQAVWADANFNQGVKFYGQRNFKSAADSFEKSIKISPWDPNAYYYLALSYHQLGNYAQAKDRYRQLVTAFPTSPAAQNALVAIQQLDPGLYQRLTSAGATPTAQTLSTSSASATLPDSARIYFTREVDGREVLHLVVDAEVNGRGIKMYFDTGAEDCSFGKNHLQQLGLNPPTGAATGSASGVGSASTFKTWDMKTTLKVGSITRRNFPISVQDDLKTLPLLGQTFFSDYTYVIDNGSNSINFTKKGVAKGQGGGANAVSFTREGKEMIVNVEVNGRACPMIFDTGAHGITFTNDQVKKLGISIPEDAQSQKSGGVGGDTTSKVFSVEKVRLGPVEKRNISISVVEDANMPHPLLGQTFFGDWQYTIDNSAKMIHFLRR